jgi:phage tail-like protein
MTTAVTEHPAGEAGRLGLVADLRSPRPLGEALPGLYQDDDFTMRFVEAFDDAYAPVLCALDNLDAYFDPPIAPPDFIDWLASWVGLVVDERWSIERRRSLVSRAVEFYRWRGTARALAELVELFAGVVPEVDDSGAMSASTRPKSGLPGAAAPRLTVRVRLPSSTVIDEKRLHALVDSARPAHVVANVEVIAEGPSTPPAAEEELPPAPDQPGPRRRHASRDAHDEEGSA